MFKDESFPLRGTTLLHPCLTTGALWSTIILLRADGRTRRSLYGIPSAVSRAAPRPCSAGPSVPVSTNPGSLCRIFQPTLLFLAFVGRDSVPLGLCLVYNRMAPSVNWTVCTKRADGQTKRFAHPADFYMPPGERLSRFTCRLASRRPLRRLFLVSRLSEPTAVRVPAVWTI